MQSIFQVPSNHLFPTAVLIAVDNGPVDNGLGADGEVIDVLRISASLALLTRTEMSKKNGQCSYGHILYWCKMILCRISLILFSLD